MDRLKKILEDIPMGKSFMVNMDILLNEKLPVKEEKVDPKKNESLDGGNMKSNT